MKELIDKSAVAAEIKRLIDSHKSLKTLDPTYCDGLNDSLEDVLSFLDTLEVKEVDLEKEIHLWMEENTCEGYCSANIRETAEHFFELGLKAKGE